LRPGLVPPAAAAHRVVPAEERIENPPGALPASCAPLRVQPVPHVAPAGGTTRQVALGAICGARSGDKGGNANVGVWVRTPEAYAWLVEFLSLAKLRELIS